MKEIAPSENKSSVENNQTVLLNNNLKFFEQF